MPSKYKEEYSRTCAVCDRDVLELSKPRKVLKNGEFVLTQPDNAVFYAFNEKELLIDEEKLDYVKNPNYKVYTFCRADYNLMLRESKKFSQKLTPEQMIRVARKKLEQIQNNRAVRGQNRKTA